MACLEVRASVTVTCLLGLLCAAVAAPAAGQGNVPGTVSFPNSGSPAAQAGFLNGVRLLHSFEWEDAAEAFRQGAARRPGFRARLLG